MQSCNCRWSLDRKLDTSECSVHNPLTERIAELERVLRTEGEKVDLLSKEHYRNRIAELEAQLKAYKEDAKRYVSAIDYWRRKAREE